MSQTNSSLPPSPNAAPPLSTLSILHDEISEASIPSLVPSSQGTSRSSKGATVHDVTDEEAAFIHEEGRWSSKPLHMSQTSSTSEPQITPRNKYPHNIRNYSEAKAPTINSLPFSQHESRAEKNTALEEPESSPTAEYRAGYNQALCDFEKHYIPNSTPLEGSPTLDRAILVARDHWLDVIEEIVEDIIENLGSSFVQKTQRRQQHSISTTCTDDLQHSRGRSHQRSGFPPHAYTTGVASGVMNQSRQQGNDIESESHSGSHASFVPDNFSPSLNPRYSTSNDQDSADDRLNVHRDSSTDTWGSVSIDGYLQHLENQAILRNHSDHLSHQNAISPFSTAPEWPTSRIHRDENGVDSTDYRGRRLQRPRIDERERWAGYTYPTTLSKRSLPRLHTPGTMDSLTQRLAASPGSSINPARLPVPLPFLALPTDGFSQPLHYWDRGLWPEPIHPLGMLPVMRDPNPSEYRGDRSLRGGRRGMSRGRREEW